MNFVKKVSSNSNVADLRNKELTVYYFYKTVIEDTLDEEILLARALKEINNGEEFNIIKYMGSIWFGVSSQCSTCIYIDLDDDQDLIDVTTILKFIDTKVWKLNAGYMFIDNNYTKIIITSSKPPSELFTKSKKWKSASSSFKVENLD